jgi:TRAP-type mannitol/chloroaromatic compound transport system substrate-binding protein
VVPVTVPWEDVEIAMQTGEIDGVAWCGITEAYEVGWADICSHFLTNNISGAWIGHFFANMDRWNELPEHLQKLMGLLRAVALLPPALVLGRRGAAAHRGRQARADLDPGCRMGAGRDRARDFWQEIADESETKAKVVQIFRDYNAAMDKAGRPYRYG